MDLRRIRDAAIEINAISDLMNQEASRKISSNSELKDTKKSLNYMKERIITLTFDISKELKALQRKERPH